MDFNSKNLVLIRPCVFLPLLQVCVWDAATGRQVGHTLTGHKQWITWLSWQPLHRLVYIHYFVV